MKPPSSNKTPGSPYSNGSWKTTSSPSSQTPTDDEIDQKIRELREYTYEDDVDTDVTGNHNIVALPGSHVVINPESETPLVRKPLWVKVAISIVAALAGAWTIAQTIHEALKK